MNDTEVAAPASGRTAGHPLPRIALTGLVATLTAMVATAVAAALARAAGIDFEVPEGGETIPVTGVAVVAGVFSLVGTVIAAALLRWSARPAARFLWTAVTLTAVSLVPPVLSGANAATTISPLACAAEANMPTFPTNDGSVGAKYFAASALAATSPTAPSTPAARARRAVAIPTRGGCGVRAGRRDGGGAGVTDLGLRRGHGTRRRREPRVFLGVGRKVIAGQTAVGFGRRVVVGPFVVVDRAGSRRATSVLSRTLGSRRVLVVLVLVALGLGLAGARLAAVAAAAGAAATALLRRAVGPEGGLSRAGGRRSRRLPGRGRSRGSVRARVRRCGLGTTRRTRHGVGVLV